MSQSLSYLIQRLKPYWLEAGSVSTAIELNKIILFPVAASPCIFYDKTTAGFAAALAASVAGDIIFIPPATIAGNHTIPANVEVVGAGDGNSILSGIITNNGLMSGINVSGTLTNNGILHYVVDPTGNTQTTRDLGVDISPRSSVHSDSASDHREIRISTPSNKDSTIQLYTRSGANYSGWALMKDREDGDYQIHYDAVEDTESRCDFCIRYDDGQTIIGASDELAVTPTAKLFIIGGGITVQTVTENAFLILDAGIGGAGNQVSYIDFKNNTSLKGNIAVNEATAGTPLEFNSAVTNHVALVTGGGSVGVNTNAPGYKLDVNGTTRTKGRIKAIVTKAVTYTATDADEIILCNAAGGAITIDLPAAASNTGRAYTIKKIDASANAVTVDGNASETIDDQTTQVISYQYTSIQIVCDGTEWWIV